MRTRRNPPAAAAPTDWEHSKLAIQETGGWIKNADTKSTILAGSFGLSLTFGVPRLLEALPSLLELPSALGIWIGAGVICIAAALITAYGIGRALLPRGSKGTGPANRFSWPSLAQAAVANLPPREISPDEVRSEAWEQAASLARIAAAKYRSFKAALVAFCIYIAALFAMMTIQTIVSFLD